MRAAMRGLLSRSVGPSRDYRGINLRRGVPDAPARQCSEINPILLHAEQQPAQLTLSEKSRAGDLKAHFKIHTFKSDSLSNKQFGYILKDTVEKSPKV